MRTLPMNTRLLLFAFILGTATPSLSHAATTRRTQPAPPRIEPAGGEYPLNSRVNVTLRADPGTVLVYTTDETAPGPYNGVRVENGYAEIALPPRDTIIRAVSIIPGHPPSNTREARFTRRRPTP